MVRSSCSDDLIDRVEFVSHASRTSFECAISVQHLTPADSGTWTLQVRDYEWIGGVTLKEPFELLVQDPTSTTTKRKPQSPPRSLDRYQDLEIPVDNGKVTRSSLCSRPRKETWHFAACYQHNVDYTSVDITHEKAHAAEKCHKLCIAHRDCAFWVWLKQGLGGNSNGCYLKNSDAINNFTRVTNKVVVSGNRRLAAQSYMIL